MALWPGWAQPGDRGEPGRGRGRVEDGKHACSSALCCSMDNQAVAFGQALEGALPPWLSAVSARPGFTKGLPGLARWRLGGAWWGSWTSSSLARRGPRCVPVPSGGS